MQSHRSPSHHTVVSVKDLSSCSLCNLWRHIYPDRMNLTHPSFDFVHVLLSNFWSIDRSVDQLCSVPFFIPISLCPTLHLLHHFPSLSTSALCFFCIQKARAQFPTNCCYSTHCSRSFVGGDDSSAAPPRRRRPMDGVCSNISCECVACELITRATSQLSPILLDCEWYTPKYVATRKPNQTHRSSIAVGNSLQYSTRRSSKQPTTPIICDQTLNFFDRSIMQINTNLQMLTVCVCKFAPLPTMIPQIIMVGP